MVAELALAAVVILATAAEWAHARRVRRLAPLAFGPRARGGPLARVSPLLRVAALAALVWGMTTLLVAGPKLHRAAEMDAKQRRRLIVVLDVSPSMRLSDAGPTGDQTRTERVGSLFESLFARVPMSQFKISVVAVYNGAKPVVVDTTDGEVVWNIIRDLPMHHAFDTGKTKLFEGLAESARIAHGWPPRDASMLVVSDGDTVPATGMPSLPASVESVLVIGVGDAKRGRFIDGRQSRQDVATLRQLALRLGGRYHNGNDKQIPSELVATLLPAASANPLDRLTLREYALFACGLGGALYALLPLLLHYMGTRWSPGVPSSKPRAHAPRALQHAARST